MRDNDLTDRKTERTETAIIRRMRSPQRLNIESADSIVFNIAGFELDRKMGIQEHIAVGRNLQVLSLWPDIID